MRIAVLGSGEVGLALAGGYARHGHEVRVGSRRQVPGFDAGQPVDVAAWAELAVLAVKGEIAEELARSIAPAVEGTVLVDATNPLVFTPDGGVGMFVGFDDSLGERVQRAAPGARVVKAYNTAPARHMVDPELPGGPPTMFIAGDDADAKAVVTTLLGDTGWDVADCGGIVSARYLEPVCLAWTMVGVGGGGWSHAFKLLRA